MSEGYGAAAAGKAPRDGRGGRGDSAASAEFEGAINLDVDMEEDG